MTKDVVRKDSSQLEHPAHMSRLLTALDHDQDAEKLETIELAETFLMQLGVNGLKDILPLPEKGEDTDAYLARVWDDLSDDLQAKIEVTGITRSISLSKASEKTIQQRLYRQYVSGTWEAYAKEVGVNWFRDYVYYILRETHGLKDTKAGRWADGLQVIGWLYQIPNRRQFGLQTDFLPPTARECIHEYLNRIGRVASKLLHMIAAVNALGIKIQWSRLQDLREEGIINPEDILDQQPATKLYRRVWDVRELLYIVFGTAVGQEMLDHLAAGGKPPTDVIHWPEEVPISPSQRSLLERKLGDNISFDMEDGVRVQYKLEMIPCCPYCHDPLFIKAIYHLHPYNDIMTYCPKEHISGTGTSPKEKDYKAAWFRRQESDTGMTQWEKCDAPELEGWTPEVIEVVGITAMIFNVVEEEDA